MKNLKKTIGILLAVMILLSTMSTAVAGDTDSKDEYGVRYTGIQVLSTGLSINGWGRAACTGDVALSNNTYTAYLTAILQEWTGTSWSNVTYWTSSGSGYTGTSIFEYYYVSSGMYRMRTTATVYDSGGSFVEQATIYSNIVSY